MEVFENIARNTFAEIAARFPHLQMIEEKNPNVEINITLPVQSGLKQKIWLALQNRDELHFLVGHFWLEWFPCTVPSRVQAYLEAVTGYLSGSYRVLEHYRNEKCFKAQLQAPVAGNWQTVGTWQKIRWPSFQNSSIVEIRNA
jgi:hypothetical protein